MMKNLLSKKTKKKGFTLIELIIVLAVMAIIAAIAIPSFTAVRNNSKKKADDQSCRTIERTVLTLVADETVKVSKDVVVTVTFSEDKKIAAANPDNADNIEGEDKIKPALAEVKAPQEKDKGVYKITIKTDGSVNTVSDAK